jgi:thiosulfate/3-mercaptopyruvate sulfurtransferase
LHVLGEPVAVLEGGIGAWTGRLVTAAPDLVPVVRTPRAWPAGRFVSADQVASTDAVVFDARTAERYAHGDPAIDPRPGHVPGARSAPWQGNLDDAGRFRSPVELRARFGTDGPAVAYCGSGVTACHDLLAMELAGLQDTALYAGSWSQWGADPARPVETG